MRLIKSIKSLEVLIICMLSLLFSSSSHSQERWFQIELSIFTNEDIVDRNAEHWAPSDAKLSYPKNARKLTSLADFLDYEQGSIKTIMEEESLSQEDIENIIREDQLRNVQPNVNFNNSDFKLIDFSRDAFVQLSPNDSDFQQTNRTLERDPGHRLLFHGLWRQAAQQKSNAIPIYIEGGLSYGDNYELQGSATIRFNEAEDRIVIDAQLWLIEFSIVKTSELDWVLPEIPETLKQQSYAPSSSLTYYANKVYTMNQSREMRSNEFHYLDHPAIGMIILVKPYDVPSKQLGSPGF